MLQLDQMKTEIQQYEDTMHEVLHSLDLEYKKQRIEELQRESEAPDFWSNADVANKKMKQLKDLQTTVEDAEHIETQYEDILMLIEMGNEENDESVVDGVREELDEFKNKLEEMRLATLLTGEYDDSNAIMSLNAGAGGTESCDWCSMLYRMYTRWADRKGFKVDVMNFIDGDEAGIKSVDFQISGPNAYGYLKSERGVHRLVRISPFNAQGKRQTSFVSCDVMPDIEKDIDIVKKLLQRIKPHQIFAAGDLSDPHGTHRVCFQAVIQACEELKDEPWFKDCRLWMYRGAWQEWDVAEAEMAVPLSPEEVKIKRSAIFRHQSQKDYPLFPGSDAREFWLRAEERNHNTAVIFDKLGMAEYQAIELFVKYKFQ